MAVKYVALDFETGNASPLSACSVGIAVFEDGELMHEQVWLIRPPKQAGPFHWGNIRVHGIKQSRVAGEPYFDEIWRQLSPWLEDATLVCHNASFDTRVLHSLLLHYGQPIPDLPYLCTVKVARSVWPALENHKLDTVSAALAIPLHHHEAGSDAMAAGLILQQALNKTGCTSIESLVHRMGISLSNMREIREKKAAPPKKSAKTS